MSFCVTVEIREVVSVVGGRASLPCDLTPPFPSDEPHLILFYKDVYGTPIYRSVIFMNLQIVLMCQSF